MGVYARKPGRGRRHPAAGWRGGLGPHAWGRQAHGIEHASTRWQLKGDLVRMLFRKLTSRRAKPTMPEMHLAICRSSESQTESRESDQVAIYWEDGVSILRGECA